MSDELTQCLRQVAGLDADIDRKLAERSAVMADFATEHMAEVLAINPRADTRTDAEWWADQQTRIEAEHAVDGLTATERMVRDMRRIDAALESIERQQDQWGAEPDARVLQFPGAAS